MKRLLTAHAREAAICRRESRPHTPAPTALTSTPHATLYRSRHWQVAFQHPTSVRTARLRALSPCRWELALTSSGRGFACLEWAALQGASKPPREQVACEAGGSVFAEGREASRSSSPVPWLRRGAG